MKKGLLVLVAVMTAFVAEACRCLPLTFEEEVQSSESIFHGRVISASDYVFEIEIIQIWKGKIEDKKFKLVQGKTSCELRTFEMQKEYLFYSNGNSVHNCSRTTEYGRTADPELLDLEFRNIGDGKLIESNMITDREIEFVKSLLRDGTVDRLVNNIDNTLMFAVGGRWVNKWMFFDACRRPDWEVKLVNVDGKDGSDLLILWTGNDWKKSSMKLKRNQ